MREREKGEMVEELKQQVSRRPLSWRRGRRSFWAEREGSGGRAGWVKGDESERERRSAEVG